MGRAVIGLHNDAPMLKEPSEAVSKARLSEVAKVEAVKVDIANDGQGEAGGEGQP